MDYPEMITTQMGTHNRSENGHSAWGALYDTTALTVNRKLWASFLNQFVAILGMKKQSVYYDYPQFGAPFL
jgi:hypothetical protein